MDNFILKAKYILAMAEQAIADDLRTSMLEAYTDKYDVLSFFLSTAGKMLGVEETISDSTINYIKNEYATLNFEEIMTSDEFNNFIDTAVAESKKEYSSRIEKIQAFDAIVTESSSEFFTFALYYFLLRVMSNDESVLDDKDLANKFINYVQDNDLIETNNKAVYSIIRILEIVFV